MANIAVVDKDAEITASKSPFTRSDHSLYEGMKLKGSVETVIHKGKIAFRDGNVLLPKASGRFVERGRVRWGEGSCR
jgi:dihydropyrimidinase